MVPMSKVHGEVFGIDAYGELFLSLDSATIVMLYLPDFNILLGKAPAAPRKLRTLSLGAKSKAEN